MTLDASKNPLKSPIFFYKKLSEYFYLKMTEQTRVVVNMLPTHELFKDVKDFGEDLKITVYSNQEKGFDQDDKFDAYFYSDNTDPPQNLKFSDCLKFTMVNHVYYIDVTKKDPNIHCPTTIYCNVSDGYERIIYPIIFLFIQRYIFLPHFKIRRSLTTSSTIKRTSDTQLQVEDHIYMFTRNKNWFQLVSGLSLNELLNKCRELKYQNTKYALQT
jgi:hypothetical protein